MRRVLVPVLVVVAVLLGGCAEGRVGGGKIDFTRVDSSWSRSDFAYAAAGRDLTTEILGNPFGGVSQNDFEQAVTAAMQGAHFGPATNFTTTPGESARPLFRVRMLWNGPTSTSGARLCEDTPVQGGGPEAGGRVRLIAAFCRGGRASTYLMGSVDGVRGPDDPRFTEFVREATMALFPPRDGNFESDCMWSTC